MIKTSIENLSEPIGFDIANSDDKVQSDLLNGMGRGFQHLQDSQLCMQMCYVSDKLKPEAKRFLKKLVEHINLIEQK